MSNEFYSSSGLGPIDNSTGSSSNTFYFSSGLAPNDYTPVDPDVTTVLLSAINLSMPFRGIGFVPDVAIEQSDLQAAMNYYSDILFGAGSVFKAYAGRTRSRIIGGGEN
jgi:hypothetical protein